MPQRTFFNVKNAREFKEDLESDDLLVRQKSIRVKVERLRDNVTRKSIPMIKISWQEEKYF